MFQSRSPKDRHGPQHCINLACKATYRSGNLAMGSKSSELGGNLGSCSLDPVPSTSTQGRVGVMLGLRAQSWHIGEGGCARHMGHKPSIQEGSRWCWATGTQSGHVEGRRGQCWALWSYLAHAQPKRLSTTILKEYRNFSALLVSNVKVKQLTGCIQMS